MVSSYWPAFPGFPTVLLVSRKCIRSPLTDEVNPPGNPSPFIFFVFNEEVILVLGLLLDEQVAAVARCAFYRFQLVSQLQPFLDRQIWQDDACLCSSRLNYFNAVYVGLPMKFSKTSAVTECCSQDVLSHLY